MKKYIFMLLLTLIFSSCASLKTKNDTEHTTTTTTEVYRKGDTLNYVVPNIKYKDTTIYHTNFTKQGSNTLKIVYDKNGNQTQIDCISDTIKELTTTIDSLKDNTKTKESQFKPIFILWVFLGIACLIILLRLLKTAGI